MWYNCQKDWRVVSAHMKKENGRDTRLTKKNSTLSWHLKMIEDGCTPNFELIWTSCTATLMTSLGHNLSKSQRFPLQTGNFPQSRCCLQNKIANIIAKQKKNDFNGTLR